MRFIRQLLLLHISFVASQIANNWQFNYANKGYDFDEAIPPPGWEGINRCAEPTNQSPINLMKPLGIYGWAYGEAIPHEFENLETNYLNPKPGSAIIYKNLNHELMLNELDPSYAPDNKPYYKSDLVRSLFGTGERDYFPNSFHLHQPAEFPINGKHHDLSMHLVQYPRVPQADTGDTFRALPLAIQFSVDHYSRDLSQEEAIEIKEFFDALDFQSANSLVMSDFRQNVQIPFRNFMDSLDLSEKWMLDGSGALPPCLKRVAWQVLHKVYPIELKHKLIVQKVQLENYDDLKATSNNRGIHQVLGHKVHYIGATALQALTLGALAISGAVCLF